METEETKTKKEFSIWTDKLIPLTNYNLILKGINSTNALLAIKNLYYGSA